MLHCKSVNAESWNQITPGDLRGQELPSHASLYPPLNIPHLRFLAKEYKFHLIAIALEYFGME